jgi:hypothetical protein
MESILSTITVFPSNENEFEDFYRIFKSEVLASKNTKWTTNLRWMAEFLKRTVNDPEVRLHIIGQFMYDAIEDLKQKD